jgi:short-subunit dehydrogenase
MLATYSRSKAFLPTFLSALAEEVRAHKTIVQNLNIYFVVRKNHLFLRRIRLQKQRSFSEHSGIELSNE